MMEFRVNVAEVKDFIKGIAESSGKIFNMVRFNVKESVGQYLTDLMNAELTFYIGRGALREER